MKLKQASVICFWLALTLACSSPQPQAAPRLAQASWTLMIYCDADNSLETPQIANVKEMMQYGSTDQVQIVLLCDRSPKSEPKEQYTDEAIGGLPDWHGTKLLHVEKGALRQMADWGDANIAEVGTLRKFLEAGARAYPADHYGLIIADHGSGWQPFCVDETHGDKMMSVRDLRAGLEPFTAAHGKLELVGLDACLMGSFETAQALAPVAHYMVTSEELAPSRGWNHDRLTHDLGEKPSMTGYDLGRAIIDAYTIHFRETKDPLARFEAMGATLSMIALDQFDGLSKAVFALGDACSASLHHGRDGWIRVARARIASEEFGSDGVRGEGHEEEMHDLMGIAETLEHCGDAAIETAAGQVDDAIRKAVRYGMHGECTVRSGGISIYFPTDGITLQDPLGSAYLSQTFSHDCHWVNFLDLYGYAVADLGKEPTLKPIRFTGTKASLDAPVTLVTKCEDSDIDKAYFLMLAPDRGGMLLLGRLPTFATKDGSIGQQFKGLWFMLSNKPQALTCPVTACENLDAAGQQFLAYVPLKVQHAGSNDWIDVEFTFLVTGKPAPHGVPIFAFTETKEGPLQVALKAGDSIRPVYERIEANGDVTETSGPEGVALHLKDPADFELGWGQVSKGQYTLGFEVINMAGLSDMIDSDFELE